MILGVGIDIVEVARVLEKVDRQNGFGEKIFSPSEIAYCESVRNRGESYAARFAAKEAFLKATGFGLTLGHTLSEIEVIVNDIGKPSVILHGIYKTKAAELHWNVIHLSLSHLPTIASAVVIIEK